MKNLIYNYLKDSEYYTETLIDEDLRTVYHFGIRLKNGINNVFIDIRKDPKHVIINTYSPISIPEEYLTKVSEFVTRVNDLMNYGSFNLNFLNGDLYFTISYIYENIYEDHTKIIDASLNYTFYIIDRYIPGVLSIIYGNKDPLDVFNTIENIIKPELN